jgi:hypothetical protein
LQLDDKDDYGEQKRPTGQRRRDRGEGVPIACKRNLKSRACPLYTKEKSRDKKYSHGYVTWSMRLVSFFSPAVPIVPMERSSGSTSCP